MNAYDQQILLQVITECTNRQLISGYRSDINHLNELIDRKNAGSKMHLGENLLKVLFEARMSYNMTVAELKKRGYDLDKIKNVPAIIQEKGLRQIRREQENLATVRKAEKIVSEAAAPVYVAPDVEITPDQIQKLIINSGLDITKVIDAVIELNGIVGVGLISLGENLKQYCFDKIKGN